MKWALVANGVVELVSIDRPKLRHEKTITLTSTTTHAAVDADGANYDGPEVPAPSVITTDFTAVLISDDLAYEEVPDDVFAGYVQTGDGFAAPAVPAPSTDPADWPLNRFQFEAFVLSLGLSMAALETAINELPIPDFDKAVALSRLRNATVYNYGHPLVEQVRAKIGMTKAQLAKNWMLAKDLR